MKPACAELAELRSAFVDGALNAADYDRLSAHLAGCASCRSDVADLRSVHDLIVRNAPTVVGTPAGLSQRLVSIAGPAAVAPVPGTTRGSRRSGRIRTGVVTAAFGASVVAVGVTGYVAAPAESAAVVDPFTDAEAEFGAALQQVPLGSASLGGAVRADPTGSSSPVTDVAVPTSSAGVPITPATAERRLEQAAAAAGSVSFVGEQALVAYRTGQTYTARVQVVSQPGRSSQISVVSQNGRAVSSDLARSAGSSRMAGTPVLALLEQNFALSGDRGAVVAGRPATRVQASRDGVLAAQWWLDDATGLVLWQQRFDPDGALAVSTGFTSLELGDRPDLVLHLPPRAVVPAADVALTVSNAALLSTAGWFCPPELAGLSLLRLRADRAVDPQAVHLVYSDGLNTVSVDERRGRLVSTPAGSSWDAGAGAYVAYGATNRASWQAGDTVVTVVTDGPPGLLDQIIAPTPRAAAHERTTMERIRAGWGRILAIVKG